MPEAFGRLSGLLPSQISRRTREILGRAVAPRMAGPWRFPSPWRLFSGLRIRPKFMVLHNLFFLFLGAAIYFALIPLVEERITAAREHEIAIVSQALLGNRMTPGLAYPFRKGTIQELAMPTEAVKFLEENRDRVYRDRRMIYHFDQTLEKYERVEIPSSFYDGFIWRVRWTLFAVLGSAYLLAIFILEGLIMPHFVFKPIGQFLAADEAVRRGNRRDEMIDEDRILKDEIGQIMRSRNATVAALRSHEDELGAALAHLEAQDRLASLGLLSASVAHELNTPLAVLQGSLEKMAEQPGGDVARERLERMLRVTQRIRRISEGLIDFARVRHNTMEPVRLRPLVDEAWELLAIEERASATRLINRVTEIDTVEGNADRLVQVFVNLLRNALAAVKPGLGEITVSTAEVLEAGRRWLIVSVEDNGPGIPAEVLPALFDAFVSTRLDSRGTGLGLMIAEGIVHQHGGTISAANRAAGGARLEVKLHAT